MRAHMQEPSLSPFSITNPCSRAGSSTFGRLTIMQPMREHTLIYQFLMNPGWQCMANEITLKNMMSSTSWAF